MATSNPSSDAQSVPSVEELERRLSGPARIPRQRRRRTCCWRKYTLSRLQNSMVMAVLNIYHTYWIFAAIVVGFAIGVNLLLSWFIEWFQYSALAAGTHDSLEVLDILLKYVAVFLRSCLLIKLLSQLLRVAIWLLRDALRLEAFQVYRCILCGGAVREYAKGNADAIRHLGTAETGWRYKDSCTACLDLSVQIMIFATFDVMPPLVAALTFLRTKDLGEAGTQFCIYACGVAIWHVLLFHFAEMLNDVASKVVSWNRMHFNAAQRRHSALLSNLSLPPGVERRDSAVSASPLTESETGPVEGPLAGSARDSPVETPVGSALPAILSYEELDEEDEEEVEPRQPGAPWNVCVLLCSLLEKLLVVSIISAATAALFFFGVWRWLTRKDPLVIIAASVLAFVILCYLGRKIPRRCSSKVAEHAPKQPRSQTWRYYWKFFSDVQRWSDLHCGLDESVAAPQYELFGLVVVLQGALFCFIRWWEGVWLMSALFILVGLRRLSLGLVKPFGWLITILEALSITVIGVVFNWLYFDNWCAFGTFMLAFAVQFTLARRHLKTWRVLLWMTLALQVTLVAIVAASTFAVTQGTGKYSNFCNESHAHCQYFHTDELPGHSFATSYPFCEMKFPMSGHHDNDLDQPETLSLAQFAMFSALAYESNATFEESLERWFPSWTLVYQRRMDLMKKGSLNTDWTTFFELANPFNETSVFAVRGTHLPLEILQDLNIWSPIAIPQIASFIGPDLTSVAAQAVLVLSTALYGTWMQKQYYSELLKYVRDRKIAEPQRRFYITGHSLGGGLAQLVSMETEIPAITFSSPGVAATRMLISTNQKFQAEALDRLHRLAYVVVPDNDLVPRVDTQLGTQIRIGCSRNPMGCHSLGETLCELLYSCGKPPFQSSVEVRCGLCPSHEHLFKSCKNHTDPGDTQVDMPPLEGLLQV